MLNHHQVSKELGGPEGHARLCDALGKSQLGYILDIVPNHMSIASRENAWWWDVLENGQSSRYAVYFDVDWQPPEAKLRDTVLMPVLGDHYGRVLEAGELKLDARRRLVHDRLSRARDAGRPAVAQRPAGAGRRAGAAPTSWRSSPTRSATFPLSTDTDPPSLIRRHRDKEVLRRVLARLCWEHQEIAQAIDQEVQEINASPTELDALLERQNYRLAYWRTAGQELDYRRFFDINTPGQPADRGPTRLRGHARGGARLGPQGVLDGLRVDHPDGLRDPGNTSSGSTSTPPDGWIVVEKILEPGERLPDDWPVAGTTGYDFLNRVTGLLIDASGEAPLTDFFTRFTGVTADYPAMVRDKKHLVLKELFGSDLARLTSLLVEHLRAAEALSRLHPCASCRGMLREVIACFPVYRTYIEADAGPDQRPRPPVHRRGDRGGQAATGPRSTPTSSTSSATCFSSASRGHLESEMVMRFQQHTGPVMAKGVEDTVFYNYNRLVALNEVGGDPGRFGLSLDEFHADCRETQERWPTSMLASTTHDTKRSEDVRARIALLSEIPEAWAAAVERWAAHNERHKRDGMPDRNLEYLLYQTLVGAWPIEVERIVAYHDEGRARPRRTRPGTHPNPAYEEAVTRVHHGAAGRRRVPRRPQGIRRPA